MIQEKRERRKPQCLLCSNLGHRTPSVCHILFLRSKSLSLAHNQGKENLALFFKEEASKNLWTYLKPSQYDRKSLEHFKQNLFYIFKELVWLLCGERMMYGQEWEHRTQLGGDYLVLATDKWA